MMDFRELFYVRSDHSTRMLCYDRKHARSARRVLTMLEMALAKWWVIYTEYMASKEYIMDGGRRTCPLCWEYNKDQQEEWHCVGCLIKDDSGPFCAGTAYPRYRAWDSRYGQSLALDMYSYLLGLAKRTFPTHEWVDWQEATVSCSEGKNAEIT